MDLAKLVEIQTAFSREKFPTFWDIKTEQDLALRLEYLTNALAGEVGEATNLVKKVVRSVVYGRGDLRLDDVRQELAEEITDIFTYLLTIAGLLGLDLEKTYLQKLEKNKKDSNRSPPHRRPYGGLGGLTLPNPRSHRLKYITPPSKNKPQRSTRRGLRRHAQASPPEPLSTALTKPHPKPRQRALRRACRQPPEPSPGPAEGRRQLRSRRAAAQQTPRVS